MHIAIDATAVPPKPMGAGRYVIYLIRELAALDTSHKFTVFAHEYLRPFLSDLPGAHTRVIWLPNKPPAMRLIWEQTFFPRILRRSGVDLLHSPHYTMPLSCPVPSVITFHDMTFFIHPEMHTLSKRAFFPWIMHHSSRKADMIITDSESTRRDAMQLLAIPPEKIVTVHLGYQDIFRPITDTAILDAVREKHHLPEHFILYVGAVEPRKNLPLLLNVFDILVQQGYSQHLVIVGGLGWLYQDVLTQIDKLRAKDRIHRMGHIPYADLPVFYNLADVFVYPSIYEGFGLPPLEGMACGTPVITSDISSMPEFVGDAGVLAPPNDEAALLEAIQTVLSDDALRGRLAKDGPKQAANFTWKHTAEKTMNIYEQVLASQ